VLAALVRGSAVLLSDALPGTPAQIEQSVRALNLEGVIAKRVDSRYEPGQRSRAWVKVKFQPSQDFVVGGFLPDRDRVESLIVGVYDGRKLMAAGNVRAGLTVPLRRQLYALLQPLNVTRCPFANLPNARKSHWYEGITAKDMTKITWLKPKVVAKFAFTEWTTEGHARWRERGNVRTSQYCRGTDRARLVFRGFSRFPKGTCLAESTIWRAIYASHVDHRWICAFGGSRRDAHLRESPLCGAADA
jgi:ATP-dependent DNA ligase